MYRALNHDNRNHLSGIALNVALCRISCLHGAGGARGLKAYRVDIKGFTFLAAMPLLSGCLCCVSRNSSTRPCVPAWHIINISDCLNWFWIGSSVEMCAWSDFHTRPFLSCYYFVLQIISYNCVSLSFKQDVCYSTVCKLLMYCWCGAKWNEEKRLQMWSSCI